MNRQKALAGYTLVEVMIFLAVSGGLLASIMTMISGQQQKTQFTTGVNEFESKIQDLISDVETGYFPNNGNTICQVPGMTSNPSAFPVIRPGTAEQGSNQDCVFLGKAIQFYKDSSGLVNQYRALTIAGKRLDYLPPPINKTAEPASLEESSPRAFYDSSSPASGLETVVQLNSIEVKEIKFVSSYSPVSGVSPTYDTSLKELVIVPSVALKTSNNSTRNLGNGRVSMAALAGNNNYDDDFAGFLDSINNLNNNSINQARLGAVICVQDGSGGRVAAITIGIRLDESTSVFAPQASGQQVSTNTYLDEKAAVLGCTS